MKREAFASEEEWQVWNWLDEAKRFRLIRNIHYQPGPFELSPRVSVKVSKRLKTKTKEDDKFLFHPHMYTPDFAFTVVSDALLSVFKHTDMGLYGNVIIDVKGGFNQFGDQKQFSINQKWMWQKFNLYVEKIVPEKLFKKTWAPDVCRWTAKKHNPVKKYIGVMTVGEFVQSLAA